MKNILINQECPFADAGNTLQVWRVAANILNKQSQTEGRGGPQARGLGECLKTTRHKK
jgi:hypothetical protein